MLDRSSISHREELHNERNRNTDHRDPGRDVEDRPCPFAGRVLCPAHGHRHHPRELRGLRRRHRRRRRAPHFRRDPGRERRHARRGPRRAPPVARLLRRRALLRDRKSTRLNSSHGYISYAVFCLKKKKKKEKQVFTTKKKNIHKNKKYT